jgi:hypothetical protein
MREGQTIKTDKTLIELTRAEARGLDHDQLTSTKEDQMHFGGSNVGASHDTTY